MKSDRYNRSLTRFETSLAKFSPDSLSNDELMAALQSGTATPLQMEKIWAIAKEDIRTQIIRVAGNRRLFHEQGGKSERNMMFAPADRAIEILSHPACVDFASPPQFVPKYDPEAWSNPMKYRGTHRHAGGNARIWARTYLMKRLLGDDEGLLLRHEIDDWMDGGDAPIDVDRYPHESIYWLINPIDGDPRIMRDARVLRLPDSELFRRIGNYPCWDTADPWDNPEDGQPWTAVDITGFENI